MGIRLPHGSLSVVLDQAGKARVVASTNTVYQIGLSRIHDFIFNLLRKIAEDGTFDQHRPVKVLVNKTSSEAFYCYDLSAATDRLPIKLQIQVLNTLRPRLGDL